MSRPPLKGPAFGDGGEAFRRGWPITRIPPFYADASTNQYAWEIGWKAAEFLAKPRKRSNPHARDGAEKEK